MCSSRIFYERNISLADSVFHSMVSPYTEGRFNSLAPENCLSVRSISALLCIDKRRMARYFWALIVLLLF